MWLMSAVLEIIDEQVILGTFIFPAVNDWSWQSNANRFWNVEFVQLTLSTLR